MQDAFDGSVQLLAIIMGTIAFCVSILSPEVVWLLLGPKWESASIILSVIPFYFAFLLMGVPVRQVVQASGRSNRLLFWNLFSSLGVVATIVPGVMFWQDLYYTSVLLVSAQLCLYMTSFFVLLRGTGVDGVGGLLNSVYRVMFPYLACLLVWHTCGDSLSGEALRFALLAIGLGLCAFANYRKLMEFYRISTT
jgi:hypothetical protein